MAGRDMNFWEWRQEQNRLNALQKAPRPGGTRTPVSPTTHPGAPQSYAPSAGRNRPPGNVVVSKPYQANESKYRTERTEQPPPWVDDIDMEDNWYSPYQPLWPFGEGYVTRPREWDYPVGYNMNYIQPRMELMSTLRAMRNSWGVLATVISTRQDQLLRIPWTIQKIDKPKQADAGVKEMQKFFRRPDGKRSYSQWSRLVTDDLLVLDAPCLYFSRDRRNRPLTAERIDPMTIFPIIDDAGRRPDSVVAIDEDGLEYIQRQPAFQQIIKGLPMLDLDESEIMYVPMRPKAEMPMFGYPVTEQVYMETVEAIRKSFYQLNFWQEGTIPDLIVTVPDTWSPRQIATFQAHFDAMLSGNLRLKSKVRFLPGGMKPFDIKNSSGESLWSQRDETLIRLICYGYSVSPAPFIKMLNRSVAQNAQQMAEEEGLYPLMSFWKDDIMDPIIQERFGYEDIEFTFLPKPEPDLEKQAKIHDMKIRNGEYSVNEARDESGLEPIEGGNAHLVYVGNAVIPLEDAAAGAALPNTGNPAGNPSAPSSEKPAGRAASSAAGSAASSTAGSRPQAVGGNPQRGLPTARTSSQPKDETKKLLKFPTPPAFWKITRGGLKDAARGATEDLDTLSPQQIASGNYPKGHLNFGGLSISIENNKGSKRGEKTRGGKKKFVNMPAPYGYIRGTVGADRAQVDCYIGKYPKSTRVWVIDQDKVTKKGKNKGFDEHKVFFAYKKLKQVIRDYEASHFDGMGHERIRAITEMSLDDFKSWLKDGNTRKPVHKQDFGEVVEKSLVKSDTISTATGLNWYSQPRLATGKKKRKSKSRAGRAGPRWLELSA